MRFTNYIFLFLCLTILTTRTNFSVTEKICCSILGNEDVSRENRQFLQKALHDFGINKEIPLKRVRANAPTWISQFSSFTWFGIWINEEQFNRFSPEEKIFSAYHEAAHYKLHHPVYLLGINSCAGLFSLISAYKLTNYLAESRSLNILISSLITTLCLYKTAPYLSRTYEYEADQYAALRLLMTDQRFVVDSILGELYNETKDQQNFWFPSHKDRIHALETALKIYNRSI